MPPLNKRDEGSGDLGQRKPNVRFKDKDQYLIDDINDIDDINE